MGIRSKILALLNMMALLAIVYGGSVFAAEPATALPEAQNGVVTLETDTTLAEAWTIPADENVTLELNGKTLDVSAKGIKVSAGGSLIIQDSSAEQTGTITGNSITNLITNNKGTLELRSGTVENKKASSGVAIFLSYGTDSNYGTTSKFVMSGGTVTGSGNTVYVVGGTTVITGGTITTTAASSYALNISSSAESVTIGQASGDDAVIDIGSVNNSGAQALYFHSGTIGKFNGTIKDTYVLDGRFESEFNSFLPAGLICKQEEDTGYYRVETLTGADAVAKIGTALYASASSAAAKLAEGETLTLLKDVSGEKNAALLETTAPNATIELNGHRVTNTSAGANSCAISMKTTYRNMKDDCQVTIKNSSETPAVLTATIALNFKSGNSQYSQTVNIEGDIQLNATSEQKIKLESSTYLAYSEDAATAFANGGYKVVDAQGNAYIYGSFANAAKANDADQCIELLNNYTGADPLTLINSTATLDLAKHTYTYTSVDGEVISMSKNDYATKMTIKNGTIVSKGIGAFLSFADNTLILDDIELTVDGGYGITTNGVAENHDNAVILQNGTTINVPNGIGIYWPGVNGTVTIDNSTVSGLTGVQLCAGGMTVKGENTTITATGVPQEKTENDGPILDGAAVSVIKRDGYGALSNVTIEAGTFSSTEGVSAVQAYILDGTNKKDEWLEANEIVAITGGTFSTNVGDYVADGFEVSEGDGGFAVAPTATKISAKEVDAVVKEDGTGTIRFITKVDALGGTPTSFGTWILPLKVFESVQEDWASDLKAVVTYEGKSIDAGETYAADLTDVPAEYLDEKIVAQSFMVVDGQDDAAVCNFANVSVNAAAQ